MTTCTHPSERLYAWWARDDTAPGGQVLCIGCRACGQVLQGDAGSELAEYLDTHEVYAIVDGDGTEEG